MNNPLDKTKRLLAFDMHVEKLIRLHEMMATEEGDCEEADLLRDELVDSALELSDEDVQWSDGLAGDLYMLSDNDMYYQIENEEAFRKDLQESVKEKLWLRVLNLVRASIGISRREVALYRAMAWQDKNQRVADLFRKVANDLG